MYWCGWRKTNALSRPRHGFVAFAPSLDTIGPLAGDVATAARIPDVIAGPDDRDPTGSARRPLPPSFEDGYSLPANLTIGLPVSFFDAADDTVTEPVRTAVAEAGFEATPIDLPLGAVEDAYFIIGATEFVWYLDQTGVIRGHGANYTPAVRKLLATAKEADVGDHIASRLLPAAYLDAKTDGKGYLAARRVAMMFARRVETALKEDALVLPTLRTLPPERGKTNSTAEMLSLLGNTAPFNLAHTHRPSPSPLGPSTDSRSARRLSAPGSMISLYWPSLRRSA